jgi:hypothetical protein
MPTDAGRKSATFSEGGVGRHNPHQTWFYHCCKPGVQYVLIFNCGFGKRPIHGVKIFKAR